MTGADAELTQVFRDEAAQRLDEMDAALMAVEAGQTGAEAVDGLFRNAHTIKGAAGMLGLEDVRALAHAAEDVFGAIRDAGEFPPELAAPLLRATTALRAQVSGAGDAIDAPLAELAAAQASVSGERPPQPPGEEAPGGKAPGGKAPGEEAPVEEPPRAERPPAEPRAPAGQPVPAPPPPAPPPPGPPGGPPPGAPQAAAPPGQREEGRRMLRVPAAKIGHLLDVVGEVMQDRRRLTHALAGDTGLVPDVAEALGAGDRMLDELKDTAVALRTLPLSSITGPLPRAVRDLARDAGKEVDFIITGAGTELDRVILESLSEPLAHLLRNAVSHGIEPAAERVRAGKPARGRLELSAMPRGSLVEVVVSDDGRGVPAQVAADARREGSLTDVLTQPGYTTATEVTDVAGRGVGLDAVKAYVLALGGSIDIRSEPGQGMTVSLLLPLALALLEVLLLERGGAVYGVPLPAVEEAVRVSETLLLEARPALEVRGRALPVADIAAVLGADAPAPAASSPGLVITAGGRRAVLTCDLLVGQAEVVVKALGPFFAGLAGYLGAAILGDGRIALLLDPAVLTRGTARPAPVPAAPPAPAPAAAAAVLVVEDSFTVRELQRSILEAAGYQVVTARDGRDALRALDAHPEVALVITDLEMPELDGLDLTRAIRGDPARSSLPVVIVTSHGSEEDRRQGAAAGADAYMVKRDFDQQALLATAERLIGR